MSLEYCSLKLHSLDVGTGIFADTENFNVYVMSQDHNISVAIIFIINTFTTPGETSKFWQMSIANTTIETTAA